jgi:hypothetical protein
VILQNWDRKNEKNFPFYLSLLVNDKVLHNCMLDSRASSNVKASFSKNPQKRSIHEAFVYIYIYIYI